MQDRLPGLTARLAALERTPVSAHPDVLEGVHRELVDELDALGQGSGPADRTR